VKPKLLIVEDDRSTRKALSILLGRHGFDVTAACSLTEGRRAISTNYYDYMILDLMLPDGDGSILLAEVKASRAATKVVVTTGSGDSRMLSTVAALKPEVLLRKPIKMDALVAILK
jgi:DNA-binding response OmpR family regulator